MSADLAITVNGEPMRLPAGASVADLLERLRVSTPRVAVERNREILPKAEYPGTPWPTATYSRSWSWSAAANRRPPRVALLRDRCGLPHRKPPLSLRSGDYLRCERLDHEWRVERACLSETSPFADRAGMRLSGLLDWPRRYRVLSDPRVGR